jgi:hypothetical protein
MTILIAYIKVVDAVTTYYLKLPEAPQGTQTGQELCTLADGRTVVALFDGFALSTDQPAAIAASIEVLTPDAALKDQIKAASPHYRLINDRVRAKIEEKYSIGDEIKCLRTGDTTDYIAYIEECRAWGRAEKSKIGLETAATAKAQAEAEAAKAVPVMQDAVTA